MPVTTLKTAELATLPGKELERVSLNINPGGWAVEPHKPIATLLGSCVAVCLFDPILHIGGMNHFLLPSHSNSKHGDTDVVLSGDFAMEILLNALINKGAQKKRLVAKAFGGGNIVSSIRMAIGDRNASFAREWLDTEGIPLIGQDLGGPWSRKVVFLPGNGDVWCRRIASSQTDAHQALAAEAAYEQTLVRPAVPAAGKKIELF
ncbi:MAG TPA: chemotaxis protein CheD [Rhodocyclaceae bacterium]|nr:chemotaxis protein CheD [Rhodocyclaceae bacterium]